MADGMDEDFGSDFGDWSGLEDVRGEREITKCVLNHFRMMMKT